MNKHIHIHIGKTKDAPRTSASKASPDQAKLTELRVHCGGAVASLKSSIAGINADLERGPAGIRVAKEKAEGIIDDARIIVEKCSKYLSQN